MLGFSPLADSALADDAPVAGGAPAVDTNRDNFAFLLSGPVGALVVGAVRDAAVQQQDQVSLTPSAILAGAPVLGTPAAAATTLVQPSAIVTGAPVVATVALSYNHDVAADDIVTAAPVAAPVALSYEQDLSAVGIVTAAPVLGTPLAEEAQPFPVNGIVTGAPTFAGLLNSSLSGSTVVGVLSVPGDYYPIYGIAFSKDGDKLYLSSSNPMGVFQYSLSDPFEAESASYDSFLSTSGVGYRAPLFNGDGTAFYISDNVSRVYKYTLSTPFDLGTASYNSLAFTFTEAADPWVLDTSFNDDGTKFYVLSARFEQRIHQYSLSTPYDLTSHSYDNVSLNLSDSFISVKAFCFANFGRTLHSYSFNQKKFSEYALISPYDISSAVSTNIGYFISGTFTEAATINSRGTSGGDRLYLTDFGSGNNYVRQYDLGLTEASVTIEQEGAFGVVSIVTGPPVVAEAGMAQQIVFAPTAALTGSPVVSPATPTQSHDLSAATIAAGAPVLAETGIGQAVQVDANGITTGQPVLQPTNIFGSNALFANDIIAGEPVAAQGDLDQQHTFAPVAVLTGSPVIETAITQENVLSAAGIVTGDPAVSDSNIGQAHQLDAGSITTGQPVLQSTNTFGPGTFFATAIVAGAPDLGLLSLAREQQFVVDPITAGQPSLQNADMVQGVALAAVNINAAPPSLGLISISQDHEFAPDGLTSEPPSLGQTIVTRGQFTALGIAAGNPVLGLLTIQREQALSADGITTGPPALVTLLINGSARRIVDQSASSNNNVAVTTGPNIAIVSERYSRSA